MTWSLGAIGHVAEELEHEIADKLHELLSDPRFGAEAYRFAGDFVTRDLLHTAPVQTAPAVPDAAVQELPSAQEAPPAEPEPPVAAEPAPADGAAAAAEAADAEPAAAKGG